MRVGIVGSVGSVRRVLLAFIALSAATLLAAFALLLATLAAAQVARADHVDTIESGDVEGLIAALVHANSESGTVTLEADGEYVLTVAHNANNGLPLITGNVTIEGNGATIRRSDAAGTPQFRIFRVTSNGALHLQHLTISNGYAPGDAVESRGGGIDNEGELMLTGSIVNASQARDGGGIFNFGGDVTITNSTVNGNNASFWGGGIYNTGNLEIIGSTVSDNQANISSSAANGGGIVNSGGTAILTSSTVKGNQAGGRGGGMFNQNNNLSVTNSIVTGNSALVFGGGGIDHVNGTATLTNSTVSGNISNQNGGGILNIDASVYLANSIVWGNSNQDVWEIDDNGATTTFDHVIIGAGNVDCEESDNCSDANPLFVDRVLASSAPTTAGNYRLLPSSPAIDAGSNALYDDAFDNGFVDTDRDGNPRFVPDPDGPIDLGAYEAQFTDPELKIAVAAVVALDSEETITLRVVDPTATGGFAQGWRVHLSGHNGDETVVLNAQSEGSTTFSSSTAGTLTIEAQVDSLEDSATVTVASLPILNLPDDMLVPVAESGEVSFVVSATDWESNSLIVDCDPASGSSFPVGETLVECSTEDSLGQVVENSFAVTVASLPVLTVPVEDVTIPTADAAGYDLTTGVSATDWENESLDDDISCEVQGGGGLEIGQNTIQCSVEDSLYQQTTESYTLVVASLPELTLPGSVTANFSRRTSVTWSASATDWTGSSIAVTCTPASGSAFEVGDTTVECEATDSLGQTVSGSFVVTVLPEPDPRAPLFRNLPADIVVQPDGPSGTVVDYPMPHAVDDTDGTVPVTCEPEPGSLFAIGHNTVICTTTNSLGLTSTAAFAVIVAPWSGDEPDMPDFTPIDGPDNPWFWATWARTDLPVRDGHIARTWMWGPGPFTGSIWEPYTTELQNPGGDPVFLSDLPESEREVIYFDKARMETNDPDGDTGSIWYVTNGLLVIEMITGNRQFGDDLFKQYAPSTSNIAGDADGTTGPTYAALQNVLDAPAQPVGTLLTQEIDHDGAVTTNAARGDFGLTVAHVDGVTQHGIAGPFWEFMTSSGLVYEDGSLNEDALFESPVYATGRPITEAYWTTVPVAGEPRDVLIQCFERRCLTWTPGNQAGFVVEAGNVGQHYFTWRYVQQPD